MKNTSRCLVIEEGEDLWNCPCEECVGLERMASKMLDIDGPPQNASDECDLCGGEGVVGGLCVGDLIVDERCGRCRGTGRVIA